MAGNPKHSPWHSTRATARKRKPITLTLSEEGRAGLEALAAQHGLSLSQMVEALVKAAEVR